MPYGTIKIDTITFTDAGVDKSIAVSGLVQNPTFTGNVTVTGTVSGATVCATTVSGVTVSGTTANFASGVFTTQISGAIYVAPAGTAGAPSVQVGTGASIAPGLYSPATDQLGISTGGSFRLVVDSIGRVGIGSTTPNRKLEVSDASADNFIRVNTTGATKSGIEFANGGTAYGQLYFNNIPPYDLSLLQQYTTGSLILGTNSTERLRIDSSGQLTVAAKANGLTNGAVFNVPYTGGQANGISLALQVAGTGNANALARINMSTVDLAASNAGYISFATSPGGAGPASGDLTTERMRIDSSGRVGIGTSSPGAILHTTATSAGAATIGAYLQNSSLTAGTEVRLAFAPNTNLVSDNRYSWIGALNVAGSNDSALTFATAPGGAPGTERMRIDSSGRLLVGTSTARSFFSGGTGSPRIQQEAASFSTAGSSLFSTSNAAGEGNYLAFGRARGGAIGSTSIVNSGDNLGFISFCGSDGAGTNHQAARIDVEVDGTPGVGDMPGRLVFSTTKDGTSSPVERFRISNDGFFRFLTPDSIGVGAIKNSRNTNGDQVLVLQNGSAANNTSSYYLVCQEEAVANRCFIYGNGNIANTNNSYGAISDLKLKENIVLASSQWNDIKALQVRKYNFKVGTGQPTHTQIGLIAQEVEEVSPGLVYESPDLDAENNDLGTVTKSVNYSVLYMKAVKALQEAIERIETLEAKVAALEAQ